MRRVAAAVAEKRLSENVIVQTEVVREGLRRRSNQGTTFQDMLGMRRNPSGESVTPPRLGTSIAGDGRPERSLGGDSTHELPAMPTVATATTPRSPFARSTASHSLIATNRVRLEDLVTEHELGDSSEVVARRVAGYLDLVASVALPLAYLLFILIYLLQYEAASMIQRSHNRKCALNYRAQVPLDGRGPLQGDEVRPRVAARRRDVEVLLPQGPGAGLNLLLLCMNRKITTLDSLRDDSPEGRAPASDFLAGGAGHHGHVAQRGDADVARRLRGQFPERDERGADGRRKREMSRVPNPVVLEKGEPPRRPTAHALAPRYSGVRCRATERHEVEDAVRRRREPVCGAAREPGAPQQGVGRVGREATELVRRRRERRVAVAA